ncbi:hypothetical protein KDW_08190 [Dictyobacter vulcani]|uniref:N-acetyltransferase domain-containing protein n=1 Tax=Dictyobacter vulcani TaxID=2607529 RepID=A0A5J4KJP0_9CHLR|nr:GNAT family N-acetyltransferase [Dictyobacter vulcani]GER86657.1 hypothetical protein KDW_08190 [Dictyobacter vulcani]
MIIRLHQLSARAPRLQDLSAVARLINIQEENPLYAGQCSEEKLRSIWQDAYFQLSQDAWLIVTRQGEIIGYADVQRQSEQSEPIFALRLYVDPEYHGRGIESLLIRLGEERIRQLGLVIVGDQQIIVGNQQIKVRISIDSSSERLYEVLLYEGYCLIQQFLCMSIAMEQMAEPFFSAVDGMLTLQVELQPHESSQARNQHSSADVYQTQKYAIYEKALGGQRRIVEPKVALPCVAG